MHGQSFGHDDELVGFDSGWHEHAHHQLLYALEGTLRMHVGDRQWLLPPQRGAWITGGVSHRVTTEGASLRTVYFSEDPVADLGDVRVFAMPPLAREMVRYSIRWGRDRADDSLPADFFSLLLDLVESDWSERTYEFSLPEGQTRETRRAIDFAMEHLDEADLQSAAEAAFVSPRTLSRRFADELGTTWRDFLRQARMIRAMELLAAGATVTETSLAVGYDSLSAFSHAFKSMTGESPRSYCSVGH